MARGSLFLLALVCAAPAFAQPAPQRDPAPRPVQATPRSAAAGGSAVPVEDPAETRRLFRKLDRNGDGCLSPDELWAPASQRENWAAIDRNRNGCIARDEFTVVRPR